MKAVEMKGLSFGYRGSSVLYKVDFQLNAGDYAIFTGENGRRVQSSTGMGLYLCKKLCGKLGHDILIHSVKNSYTEVEIRFWKHEFYQVLEDDGKLTKL